MAKKSFRYISSIALAIGTIAATPSSALAANETLKVTGLSITQGTQALSMKVSWTTPSDRDGLVGYEIQLLNDGTLTQVDSASATYVVGLDNQEKVFTSSVGHEIVRGSTYQAKVIAQYGGGNTGFYEVSTTVGAKAFEAPGLPTSVESIRVDTGALEISWVEPADNGGDLIAGYEITCIPTCTSSELGSQSLLVSASPMTITGLDTTIGRSFTVKARNSKYKSLSSLPSDSVTPYSPPSTPGTPFSATAGNAVINVSWGASSVTGATLTGYRVELFAATDVSYATVLGYKNLTNAQVATGRTAAFNSLTNGTGYVVRVAGVAGADPGAVGSIVGSFRVSDVVTPTAPAAIATIPTAKKGASLTAKKVAKLLGLTIPAKAKVSLKKGSGMSKICTVKSGKLRMLKAGKTCKVTVIIKPKKGKTKTYRNKKIAII